GFAGFAGATGFAGTTGFAAAAGFICVEAAGTAAATFPFPLAPVFVLAAAGTAAAAAALAPLPRLAGGGGGGGGASGFRYFRVSVRERSLPSNNSMNTSFAIFGYAGISGVMRSSVISGNGIFCCTCRHLVKKFLIFCATACC